MNGADLEAFLGSPAGQVVVPFITFLIGGIGGFWTSRFTLSKAERKEVQQRLYENAVRHKQDRERYLGEFTAAMRRYISKEGDATLDDFHSIACTGDLYFNEMKIVADAILGGNIDAHSRDHTFVPLIHEAVHKSLPSYYTELKKLAEKIGAPYGGTLKRSNYESLFVVVEKYASAAAMPAFANSQPKLGSPND